MELNEKRFFVQPEAAGLVYPLTASVQQVSWHEGEWFKVVDETGWTGFETCDPFDVALIRGEKAATDFAKQYVRFSDTEEVFSASVDLLNKEPEAFKKLKAAVSWQDRR